MNLMNTLDAGIEKMKGTMGQIFRKSPRFQKLVEVSTFYFKNPEKLNEIVTETYNRATNEEGQKTLADMWDKITAFYRLVSASMRGEYKELPSYKIVIIIGALVYMVSPYDIIPDKFPMLGAIDDLAVLSWLIKTMNEEVVKFQEWESTRMVASEQQTAY